ncbi:MAG: DUF3772 domain-containing protein [Pseudoxanthomonas sp.]
MPKPSRHALTCLLLWLALLWPALGRAQNPSTDTGDAEAQLRTIAATVQDAQDALPGLDDADDLRALADKVSAAQRQADALAGALQPQLQQTQDRLGQLGEAAAGESDEIAGQRRELQKQQARVDGQAKQARLLSVEARQLGERIERARADHLGEQLSARAPSPLSATLWRQMSAAWSGDAAQLSALWKQSRQSFRDAVASEGWGLPVLGLALAIALLWPLRWLLRWLGQRYASMRGPETRLRRSGLALWRLLVGALLPGAAAWALVESLRGIDALPPALDDLAGNLVRLTLVSAGIASVAAALLTRQPSWRLVDVDDAIAARLRYYARIAAGLVWLSGVALLLNRAVHSAAAVTALLQAVVAVLFALLVLAMLSSLQRAQPAAEGEGDATAARTGAPARRHSGVVNIVALLGQFTVAVALVAALLGYVAFALFATRQLIWTGAVVAVVSLLLMFVDDLMHWLFAPDGRLGRAAGAALGLRPSHLDQAATLSSAVLRLWLLMVGAGLLLAPYGANLQGLLAWLGVDGQGLVVGGFALRPGRLFQAIAVCVIGLGLVSGFQRWLTRTYLPKTDLEPGSRTSIAAVTRYLGIAVVVLWTLTALDFDVKNLALLASALSVGIGFGLQAITQNFISGLILMVERPVKIGDRISIGDGEGDVRGINVRATEIQMDDKSTLIVPNSELITKSIRNRTLSRPPGRIQLQFSVPLGTDVGRVRELLLDAYARHAGVLEEPAPSVYIDSIAGGQVAINSFAYCASPRIVYGTRSELWFAVLKALSEAGIALSAPQDVRIVGAPPRGAAADDVSPGA